MVNIEKWRIYIGVILPFICDVNETFVKTIRCNLHKRVGFS